MKTLTKDKLIGILGGEIILTFEKRDGIISEILLLYNAEIAKYKELVADQKELYLAETALSIIVSAMSNQETEFYYSAKCKELEKDEKDTIQKCIELRRKIAELESEVGK